MHYGYIKFKNMPSIGFAHHFYTNNDDYSPKYGNKNSIEIVYINSGGFEMIVDNETICAPAGSIMVLFRALPIALKAVGGKDHSHSTVQFEAGNSFLHLSHPDEFPTGGALLPFVLMPCVETEAIKKEIFSIISELSENKRQNLFSALLKLVSVIKILDECARGNPDKAKSSQSIISYKVKNYIAKNISSHISLADIAHKLSKTPNYINAVFKKENGTTIIQYTNSQKIAKIGELLTRQKMSFKDACRAVGIENIQYCKKMFVKHMGISPESFAKGDVHRDR